MELEDQTVEKSEGWFLLRDFCEKESGTKLPKYEAKYIRDVDEEYIEDNLIVVRETNFFGGERTYHVPEEVFRTIADELDYT